MTFSRLLRRRARAQLGLLALVGAIAALVSATLVAVLGYVALSAQAGLAAGLREAGPTGAAVQLATPRSEHTPDQQVAAAEQVIDERLSGFPVVVQRSDWSTPVTAGSVEVAVAAAPNLDGLVTTVSGTMPSPGAPGADTPEATMSAATAATLDVAVGDRLTLTGASDAHPPLVVDVAAIWDPIDRLDPRWFGAIDGAVWVDEATLDRVPATVRVRWTVVPDPTRLAPEQVPALRGALGATLAALKADDVVDELGVLATDGLDRTLASLDRTLSTVRALSLPATLLAVLVGLVVLGQLAVLLADVRRGELVLLRSRGASRGRAVGAAAVEGLVIGALGAAAGGGIAALGLRGVGAVPALLGLGAPAGVAAGVCLILAGVTGLRVRGPLREVRQDRPARASGLLGAVGLALAGAGLGLWRLASLGTPVRSTGGRASPDPLASAALGLALLAIALVVATLVPPMAKVSSRWAARLRGLRVLAAAQVARRPTAHAATAALVALAVATSVTVAVILGSWSALQRERSAVETGADVRIATDARAMPAVLAAAQRAAPGAAVVPAETASAVLGAVHATVVAVPGSAWPLLHHSPQDAALASPDGVEDGVPVPEGATAVRATIAVEDTSLDGQRYLTAPGASVWIRTAPGTLTRVEMERTPTDTADTVPVSADGTPLLSTWTAALPSGARIVGFDVTVFATDAYRVVLSGLSTDAGPLDAAAWQGALFGGTPRNLVEKSTTDGAIAYVPAPLATTGDTVRLLAASDRTVPVVATRAFASALALRVGDSTRLVLPGHQVDIRIAGIISAVPGTADPVALLVELDTWSLAQLWTGADATTPTQVWAWPATGPADTTIASAVASTVPTARISTSAPHPTPLLDPALIAFRLATWTTVALAAGGVLAAARATARTRRREIGALRGLGVPGREQAALRVAEQARVLVPAVLGAGAGGLGLAALVARPLVDALDDSALTLPIALGLDAAALAAWLGATVLALVLVVAATARDTAHRARLASPREVAP